MNHPHEYASIEWIDDKNMNIVFNLLKGIDFNNYLIQVITYFAEWCPNCQYESKPLKKLFKDYHSRGLGITIIMDYSSRDASDQFIKKNGLQIPTHYGELDKKDKSKRIETSFYQFRKSLGDPRDWGVPFHIIIAKDNPSSFGIIMGEFKDNEIRSYLSKYL
tara:strand:+ start:62 stop:547 length:486 start_codon:yes stop_codon:yes gene_type:complete